MKKKSGYLLSGVLVALCFFVMFYFKDNGRVEREKDQEFVNGTQIRLEELSHLQTESLYKLCKVWGYAKYRHPSVVDGTLNWDNELLRVIPKVVEAGSEAEANQRMADWLKQFPYEIPKVGEETMQWLEMQEQFGFLEPDTAWTADRELLGEDLCRELERLSQVYISDREYAYASFEAPPYVDFENEQGIRYLDGDDGVALLSLFRFWNIYEYYSPYREITKKDWDMVLKDAIPKIVQAADYREYVLAIAETTAQTGDAHLMISDSKKVIFHYYGKNYLPCRFKVIDGQAVVSYVEGESGLRPGDIIREIDGISIEERIETLSRYTAIPEEDKFCGALQMYLLKSEKPEAEVKVLREGKEEALSIKTLESPVTFQNPYTNGPLEESSGAESIEANIGYIDPSALKKGDVEKLMEEFRGTDGIIVDLRYYPSQFLPYLMGEYVIPEPTQFAGISFANPAIPGGFYYLDNNISGAGVMEMIGDSGEYYQYEGMLVLLIDESTQSQPEFTAMALRQAPNAVVLGGPSIGADGNVVKVSLPGGIRMYISGIGIYTPEGGQTQRVGIQPDIECYPTAEGIAAGRDELIEKAVELIDRF